MGVDLLLVTEFPHSIGSRILPVLPQHIPAFSLPHFTRIQSRTPAFPHFTNTDAVRSEKTHKGAGAR